MIDHETNPDRVAAVPTHTLSYAVHSDLLAEIVAKVQQLGLARLERVPTRLDRRMLPFEAWNLVQSWRGHGVQILNRTASPGLYQALIAARSRQLAMFLRLFVTGTGGRKNHWYELLGEDLTERAVNAGVLAACAGTWVSRVRIIPCHGRAFVSDSLDAAATDGIWLGKDSLILIDELKRRLGRKMYGLGVEIGCGSGIVSVHMSDHCQRVIGVDINRRALECAELNGRINGVRSVEFRSSNLFQNIAEEADLIVCNPPHVFVPPTNRSTHVFADGGEDYGTALQIAILEGLERRLRPQGVALLLLVSPVVNGIDILPDRVLRSFAGRPLDFVFDPLFNNVSSEYYDFHRAHGISFNWVYLVTVRRAAMFSCRVRRPGAWVRARSFAFRTAVHLFR
jgi:hypothetical protein